MCVCLCGLIDEKNLLRTIKHILKKEKHNKKKKLI